MAEFNTNYVPEYTAACFHKSDDFVRGLMGPIGSGKSVTCAFEIMRRATTQSPDPSNKRRYTRFAIIRNTYRELEDTTLKTWFDWFPMEMGAWKQSSMTHILRIGDIHCEVLFRALDRPDHVAKLLSLELTGAWINEAREVGKTIVDMLTGRVGRYPSKRRGGPTWSGIWMDTNPPDTESWWYRVFEEQRPKGWTLFRQPSSRSRAAENKGNLPSLYYERMMQGKDDEWVRVYVDGDYGFTVEGKPVHAPFQPRVHVLSFEPELNQRIPLGLGCDFGLTPAAVVGQRTPSGRWVIADELTTEDTGASAFGSTLRALLNSKYPGYNYEGWGDPSGDARSQLRDFETVFTVLAEEGIDLSPAPTNDPIIRIEAVNRHLKMLAMDGEPALMISPRCTRLIKALTGGYHYKRVNTHGEDRFHEKPFKNVYSHVAEALQYLIVGSGDADELLLGAEVDTRFVHKPKVHRALRGGRVTLHRPSRTL